MALVFIATIMMLQLLMRGCVSCVETERIGLLHLKSYLNSVLSPEEESILKSWIPGDGSSDCCYWEGVKCSDGIGRHIVHLSLVGLAGTRTDAPRPLNLSLLHSFPQLQTFNFSWNMVNHFFDPIYGYKSFQRLEKLRTLNFYANDLNNSILPFLNAARFLTTLDLGLNGLKGVFPPNELANMTELRVMNMQRNRFSSFSVQGLENISNLEVLDLSYNSMTDVKAGDGLKMTKLKTLDLSFNNLSATTRLEAFKYMSKLQELDLSDNGFIDLDSLGLVLPLSLQGLNLAFNQLSSTTKGTTFALTKFSGYSKICRLTYLQELNLQGNALTSIPYCLGNLSRLRSLDLSRNQLDGHLSSFVSGLPSALEYLSLLSNNFNGGSFWFSSLANHTKLTVLELSSTVGTIQDLTKSSWAPLFQLKTLTLRNFIFDSTLPTFLLHQHDLCYVDLSYNNLTGAFPTWLVQNNTRLLTLVLNNNFLNEVQLPKLVHSLQALDVSSNTIHDAVQEDIGIVFPKLRYMNFSSNRLHGSLPLSMGEMKSLEILDVSSNGLHGELPKPFLSNCYSLRFLSLSKNQFQGEIFPEHANLSGLNWLYLDGNSFSGSLGKGMLNSKGLYVLDISENSISGSLPIWIGTFSSSLSYLYMGGNNLSGPLPHQLQSLSQQLQLLDISRNRLSGSVPTTFDFPRLRELRLHSNEFVGPVPDTLFRAASLKVLDLRNNRFSRVILNNIGENSNLVVLLLRNNSFRSHIPEKICQLSKVGILDLSHNKFSGAIPSCLGCNMSFGVERSNDIITVYGNFGGSLDLLTSQHCKYASRIMQQQSFFFGYRPRPVAKVDFVTKSRYEAYQGEIISYMSGLDLSSNRLSGEIPVEIGNLKNIRSLNFSNNHLTGSIPDSISELEDLGSLDLSNNNLDGNIPPQLADLNSLGYFNVSYNNLSGEIPFEGHLVTFEESCYIGNAHLCGLPTNNSCRPVSEQSAPNQDKEEEGDSVIDMAWFYWICGAVYIFTTLAMSAFFLIDSRWSRGWFYWDDLSIHYLRGLKDRGV